MRNGEIACDLPTGRHIPRDDGPDRHKSIWPHLDPRRNGGIDAEPSVFADPRASAKDGSSDDESSSPNPHAVSDVNQIVNFCIVFDDRLLVAKTLVDRSVGADLDSIADLDTSVVDDAQGSATGSLYLEANRTNDRSRLDAAV